ncbi:hypothetical protein MYCTH_101172 [Thermothelomyces thermophilus ATCC 42464]|uniref:Transcription factor domain-containing protein n=1 Tax=Thermothelomyces thermophilus (strain ATCC 42464 / BCRC 31852 / DSM 1799) TaxID=573729 RepID=G2QAE5_THET4|nr:uncharacterized protein MYCTH_101172 [Thermothelomyces thermophilus ATCC 42464]AEO55841.1 hypothetical protein MYCTH_101172 [Thermothelomyces thermophilus ATCC 42464]
MSITACQDGCTCTSHSAEVHHAIRTLRAYRSAQDGWSSTSWSQGQEISAWILVPAVFTEPDSLSWPISDPVQGLGRTLSAQTMPNQELLMVFTNFLSKFTASLDGNPEPSNPYIKYYVPYCVNSQLLLRVAIYSAACFLTDTGHVDRTVAMAHKGHVFRLLNEHIRSRMPTTDEVIAEVLQIILNEWLWGNADDLRAHQRGLRDMIKCRGGFRMLGLHGLISKLAISADAAISLSLEVPPYLRGGPELEFSDSSPFPLRVALNTPLIPTLVRFSSCADALRIHPAVASILDDMRFLLAAVLALPAKPSAKELQKVQATSAWIHERISGLSEDSPATRRPPEASSAPRADGSMVAEISKQVQSPHGSASLLFRLVLLLPPDHIYQAIRLAALLYSRAIMHRRAFSRVVMSDAYLRLWTTAWRVPLSTWRSLLGVLTWILLPLPHDRYMRGMLNICMFQMGMDNWEIASSAMEAGLRLQRRLAGEPVSPSEAGE